MSFLNEKFSVAFKETNDLIDITLKVQEYIRNLNFQNALLNIYTKGSDSSIVLFDCAAKSSENNLISLIDAVASINPPYDSLEKQYNPIVKANIKAAILGQNITIPVVNKKLEILDTQKIVLIYFGYTAKVNDVIMSLVFQDEDGQNRTN